MVKIVNCGLYNVNLNGDSDCEFDGEHPTLVIRTKMEKDIYMAIPFTSFKKERWNKLKKYMCCRVKSTNSIARIDKMEIVHVSEIKNRWKESTGKILIPSKDDLELVLEKMRNYINVSFNDGINEFSKLDLEKNNLMSEITNVLINENITNKNVFDIKFDTKNLIISFDLSLANKLSLQDLYELFNSVYNRKSYKININNDVKKIEIFIFLSEQKALTLKEKYAKLDVTEG